MFAGIGQLLLAADRFRAEEAERERSGPDEQSGPLTGLDGEHAAQGKAAAGQAASAGAARTGQPPRPARFRSLDSTGNVRVLRPDEAARRSRGRAGQAPAAPASAAPASAAPASAAPAGPSAPNPAGLPVPGYDGISLPALRARLRNLDAAQLRVLLDYERSAAHRTDVVTMFERRIAKLEAAGRDAT